MKRLYAEKYLTTEDEVMIQIAKELNNKIGELPFDDYKSIYKSFCNMIREKIGTDRVLGTAIEKQETHVLVPLFDILATDDNFFIMKQDEENKQFYIEVI
jgi:hypothetical protein